ncbi:MAG: hypothetical protein ACTSPB_01370 [Candidatus Thorarchaeota archaeon]
MTPRSNYLLLDEIITLVTWLPFVLGYGVFLLFWMGFWETFRTSFFCGLAVFIFFGVLSFGSIKAGIIHKEFGWGREEFRWIKQNLVFLCNSCNNPMTFTQKLSFKEDRDMYLVIDGKCPFCGYTIQKNIPTPDTLKSCVGEIKPRTKKGE